MFNFLKWLGFGVNLAKQIYNLLKMMGGDNDPKIKELPDNP